MFGFEGWSRYRASYCTSSRDKKVKAMQRLMRVGRGGSSNQLLKCREVVKRGVSTGDWGNVSNQTRKHVQQSSNMSENSRMSEIGWNPWAELRGFDS